MQKIGNLFILAEQQLIKEREERIIPCYTLSDVIEYAIQIREWLDKHKPRIVKKLMRMTFLEKKRHRQFLRREKYIRLGI